MSNANRASLVVLLTFALLFSQHFASARRLNKARGSRSAVLKRSMALQEPASIVKTGGSMRSISPTDGSPADGSAAGERKTLQKFFLGAMAVAGIAFNVADAAQGCGLCVVGPQAFNAAMTGAAGAAVNFIGWAGIGHSIWELAKHGNQIRNWDNETTGCEKNLDRLSLVFAILDVTANIGGQIMFSPAGGAAVGAVAAAGMTAWDRAVIKLKAWCRTGLTQDPGEELETDEEQALNAAITVTTAPPTQISARAQATLDAVMPAPQLLTWLRDDTGWRSQWQVPVARHFQLAQRPGPAIRYLKVERRENNICRLERQDYRERRDARVAATSRAQQAFALQAFPRPGASIVGAERHSRRARSSAPTHVTRHNSDPTAQRVSHAPAVRMVSRRPSDPSASGLTAARGSREAQRMVASRPAAAMGSAQLPARLPSTQSSSFCHTSASPTWSYR